jgi:hypothetical protein
MDERVKTIEALSRVQTGRVVPVINIVTMKKKHIEQLEQVSERDKVEVLLGKCAFRIIVKCSDGNLRFVHYLDWISGLVQANREKGMEIMTAEKSAQDAVAALPQIFED